MDSVSFANKIASFLEDKKGKEIELINIKEISALTDCFVICSGTSNVHVRALADEVQGKLMKDGIRPLTTCGYKSAEWILLDYGQVLVHIFSTEARAFYNIERLWADGLRTRVVERPIAT